MIFAIPSKGRAGKVKSLKHLPFAVLFVPASEVKDYQTSYPSVDVMAVPVSIIGITATRNWILANVDDDDVVMVDDDVKACGYVRLDESRSKHCKIVADVWVRESAKLFELTRQLNFRLWGIATQSATRSVYPYKPLLFRSYVTASFCGICRESGLRFDEAFRVKEDYELNLRCVIEDGGVVAARYLYWENSHWGDEGGCKEYRTQNVEKEAIRMLRKKYPTMVRQINRGDSDYSVELVF